MTNTYKKPIEKFKAEDDFGNIHMIYVEQEYHVLVDSSGRHIADGLKYLTNQDGYIVSPVGNEPWQEFKIPQKGLSLKRI